MNRPTKISLALTPTPIHKLEAFSSKSGKDVYIKRDDLTGALLSGNKIRKLEYVLSDAINKKVDTVVTCGGLQSNHVRATVISCRRLGLKPVAVLRGEQPAAFDGNTLLVAIAGAEIVYVTEEEYGNIDNVYDELRQKLRRRGLNPYFIPEGASNALGCWGYISMMEELDKQQRVLGFDFDSIFIALGSGGTQAGMILGKNLTGNPAKVIGINVYKESKDFSNYITKIAGECIENFNLQCSIEDDDVNIYNDYVGPGYAKINDPEMRFIMDFARDEGIILDHVYTGKALFGMADLLNRHPEKFGQKILFVHTGGLYGLFPERERITRLLQAN